MYIEVLSKELNKRDEPIYFLILPKCILIEVYELFRSFALDYFSITYNIKLILGYDGHFVNCSSFVSLLSTGSEFIDNQDGFWLKCPKQRSDNR